jgi:hypothetical protein
MKSKIIKGFITFIFTTSIMAATTLNFANNQIPSQNNTRANPLIISNVDVNNKFYGSYSISNNTIERYVKDLLKKREIEIGNSNYKQEFELIVKSINKDKILKETLLGELNYTINDNKLIIQDVSFGESFVMDYTIKDNILYGKVYNFSEEMALGHFIDNGKFLIINTPANKEDSIFLEHHYS